MKLKEKYIIYLALFYAFLYLFVISQYSDMILYVKNSKNHIFFPLFIIGIVVCFYFIKINLILRLLISIIFSFLLFYLSGLFLFTIIDYTVSSSNPTEKIIVPVENFLISTKRNSKIIVKIKGKEQPLYLHSNEYLQYQKKKLEGENVEIELKYHEGIMGTIIIEDFVFVGGARVSDWGRW